MCSLPFNSWSRRYCQQFNEPIFHRMDTPIQSDIYRWLGDEFLRLLDLELFLPAERVG